MLEIDDAGPVRWIRFTRPEQLNAFTVEGYRDFRVALEDAAGDDGVHVVVLTGEGRAYSVGADRSLLDGSYLQTTDLDAGAEFERLILGLAGFPKPLVAAVNGLAVGFGCTMLLHCDLVLAAGSARLRLPFTAMGIAPEAGSSALVLERIRPDEAAWSMLSSEWIEAEEAQRIGLVWRVVPDDELRTSTATVAARLAERDPASVAATKALLIHGRREQVESAHRREVAAMGRLLARYADPTGPDPA